MTGLLRDDAKRLIVEVDDSVLAELAKHGGRCFVLDSLGAYTVGQVAYDDAIAGYVIWLEAPIEVGARRVVKIKPRLVLARAGAQR